MFQNDYAQICNEGTLQRQIVVDYRHNSKASASSGLPDTLTAVPPETTITVEMPASDQGVTPEHIVFTILVLVGLLLVYSMFSHPRETRLGLPIILAALMVCNPFLQLTAQAAAEDAQQFDLQCHWSE